MEAGRLLGCVEGGERRATDYSVCHTSCGPAGGAAASSVLLTETELRSLQIQRTACSSRPQPRTFTPDWPPPAHTARVCRDTICQLSKLSKMGQKSG